MIFRPMLASVALAVSLTVLVVWSPSVVARDPIYRWSNLFERDSENPLVPGRPLDKSLRSSDGTTLVVQEGVDIPLPIDPKTGFGCVLMDFLVNGEGIVENYRIISAHPATAFPANGRNEAMALRLSRWRFNTSTLPRRKVQLPIMVSLLTEDYPSNLCRRPKTHYQLILQHGVSASLADFDYSSGFIPSSRDQDPVRHVRGYEYPQVLLDLNQRGCVVLSFVMGADGHAADFDLIKAWPSEPEIAGDFASAAADGLHNMPLKGPPSDKRSLALVRFDYEKASTEFAPPPEACMPDAMTAEPAVSREAGATKP